MFLHIIYLLAIISSYKSPFGDYISSALPLLENTYLLTGNVEKDFISDILKLYYRYYIYIPSESNKYISSFYNNSIYIYLKLRKTYELNYLSCLIIGACEVIKIILMDQIHLKYGFIIVLVSSQGLENLLLFFYKWMMEKKKESDILVNSDNEEV